MYDDPKTAVLRAIEKLHAMAACYTTRDLARLLGCSQRHIQRRVRRNEIPGMLRAGRLIPFARGPVDKMLARE